MFMIKIFDKCNIFDTQSDDLEKEKKPTSPFPPKIDFECFNLKSLIQEE